MEIVILQHIKIEDPGHIKDLMISDGTKLTTIELDEGDHIPDDLTKFDAILSMYHDQGLTPFKTLSFSEGVNYTSGLNIVRTSPVHGTAYDIAGKNIADERSFREAVYLSCEIIKKRREYFLLKENSLII